MSSRARFFLWFIVGIAFVFVAIGTWEVARSIVFEMRGPTCWDCDMFWAVGRGITKGYTPYADLFETKPVGIFLLSALSLALTGGRYFAAFASALNLFLVFGVPSFVAFSLCRNDKKHPELLRGVLFIAAILFIQVSTLYVSYRGGAYMVEPFGALFGVMYASLIFDKEKMTSRQSVFAGLCIAAAVLFKEPFVLSCAAVAFFCAPRPSTLITTFVVPLCWATAFVGVFLSAFGYLHAYTHTYLFEMLGNHALSDGPLWLKGFHFGRTVEFLQDLASLSVPLGISTYILFITCVGYGILTSSHIRDVVWKILAPFCAVYLLTLALFTGGIFFYEHHFSFAVPLVIAVVLVAVQRILQLQTQRMLVATAILTLFGCVNIAGLHTTPYEQLILENRDLEAPSMQYANVIDAVLDECHVDRYLFLGTNGPRPFGYTKHVPLGPLFYQYDHYLEDGDLFFRTVFVQSLQQASIVVQSEAEEFNTLRPFVRKYLEAHFTAHPWPCAVSSKNVENYRLLFRITQP